MTEDTSSKARQDTTEKFKNGEIQVLFHSGKLERIADLPNIDSVILNRPTPLKYLMNRMTDLALIPHPGKKTVAVIEIKTISYSVSTLAVFGVKWSGPGEKSLKELLQEAEENRNGEMDSYIRKMCTLSSLQDLLKPEVEASFSINELNDENGNRLAIENGWVRLSSDSWGQTGGSPEKLIKLKLEQGHGTITVEMTRVDIYQHLKLWRWSPQIVINSLGYVYESRKDAFEKADKLLDEMGYSYQSIPENNVRSCLQSSAHWEKYVRIAAPERFCIHILRQIWKSMISNFCGNKRLRSFQRL